MNPIPRDSFWYNTFFRPKNMYASEITLIRGKIRSYYKHTKSILDLVNSNQIYIVITIFRMILHQAEFSLVLNQSEKCNYNPNFVWFNKIRKKWCVCAGSIRLMRIVKLVHLNCIARSIYWIYWLIGIYWIFQCIDI